MEIYALFHYQFFFVLLEKERISTAILFAFFLIAFLIFY